MLPSGDPRCQFYQHFEWFLRKKMGIKTQRVSDKERGGWENHLKVIFYLDFGGNNKRENINDAKDSL